MVSGGTVSGDASSFSDVLNSYKSAVSGIGSSWEGESESNFTSKAEAFCGEFNGITSQMESFSNACGLFEKYLEIKKEKESLERKHGTKSGTAADGSDILWDCRDAINECETKLSSLKSDINSALESASSPKLEASDVSVIASVSGSLANGILSSFSSLSLEAGKKFFQGQNHTDNCGITALMMAVNTLLGDNVYTDNIGEWNNLGCYTEAIGWENGNGQAQNWINSKGLQDTIEVTGVQNVSSKEELISHLQNGEVVVASSTGPVFKRTDGSYDNLDHYICFYGTDGVNCYANDSANSNSDLLSGIEYNPGDLDNFFAAKKGSITLKRK